MNLSRILFQVRRPALMLASIAVVFGSLVLPARIPDAQTVTAAASPPVVATPQPTPTPTPVPVFTPERITLPTLGVDAPIVPVGVEEDGAMGTPDNAEDVAWWEGMRIGGGNALLAGHRDWNKRPGSFFRLSELAEGDPVTLSGEGQELTFRVTWVKQVDADAEASDILGEVGEPVVTLITCGGVFDRSIRHYTERVVARAVLA